MSTSARALALAALREWQKGERFADTIVGERLAGSRLSAADRAFALELFYGVLRNLTLLDFWIGRLREGKLDTRTRDLARLGLYQLFLLRTPPHAALHATVALALARQRGLINALLRSAQRREGELTAVAKIQPASVRFSQPPFLLERWCNSFGETAAGFLAEWNNQPPPLYARINRLKIEPEEFHRLYPNRPLVNARDFVEFDSLPQEALGRGYCYMQDPGTATASQLLAPEEGETVLDACAAPGGKTALLAQMMKNRGIIVACDRDLERLARTTDNLQRLGVDIVQTARSDWTQSAPPIVQKRAPFDRILADVPCSNTGVMRRRVDVRWRLRSDDFKRLPLQQLRILRALIPLLKQGGTLVYSTCSLEAEENEYLVEALLRHFPQMRLTKQTSVTPFQDGFDGAFAAQLVRAVAS
jgi:16S rRNA (cytosine967-C5)-methyltransferase